MEDKGFRSEYEDKKPTEVFDIPYLIVRNREIDYPKDTEDAGKWLIFEDEDKIDQLWRVIKYATTRGIFGGKSKVSTKMLSKNSKTPNQFVICVYTYDCNDIDDRSRIREKLRIFGIDKKIPYKTNKATTKGKYKSNGDEDISLCIE